MKNILNEINTIRNNMGLKQLDEQSNPLNWVTSKSSTNYDDDSYPEPKPVVLNKGGIKATTKLTKPEDVTDIMNLMEYHQLGMLFEGYRSNFNEERLIEAHEQLSEIIINELTKAINEGKRRAPIETTQSKAVSNSANSRFFKNLLTVLPTEAITANISAEFETQYDKKLNKVEIQKFLKELLLGLSGLSNGQMLELIKKGGIKPKEYSKIINSLYDNDSSPQIPTKEPEQGIDHPISTPEPTSTEEPVEEPNIAPEQQPTPSPVNNFQAAGFTPDKIGNYDLRKVRRTARIALSSKAAEVLERNNMPVNQENILEIMRQLIDDINKSGKKRVPIINGFNN